MTDNTDARNAKRYRWLKEAWDDNVAFLSDGTVLWDCDSSRLDQAIDAAIEAEERSSDR